MTEHQTRLEPIDAETHERYEQQRAAWEARQ